MHTITVLVYAVFFICVGVLIGARSAPPVTAFSFNARMALLNAVFVPVFVFLVEEHMSAAVSTLGTVLSTCMWWHHGGGVLVKSRLARRSARSHEHHARKPDAAAPAVTALDQEQK